MTVDAPRDSALVAAGLHATLDAVLRPRIGNTHDRQDLVQEAITRTLEVSPRLAPEVVPAYAITVARNLAVAYYRKESIQARLVHRLYDPADSVAPEQELLGAESAAAVRAAVIELPDRERDVLLGHVTDGHDTSRLAAATGGTAGGVAARLARARARARVNYVLALRQQELPTGECRPVLLAISAADARRQQALDAASHLLACSTCSSLARPLAERKSVLASFIPIPLLLLLLKLRAHTGWTVATSSATAAVVLTIFAPSTAVPHSVVPPLAAGPAVAPRTPQPAPSVRAVNSAPPTETTLTVSGPAVDISAPYGFWMLTSRGEIYLVFHGLPSHQIHRGDMLRVKGKLMPVTTTLLNTRSDVLPAERGRLKDAGSYLNAYAGDISFVS